MSKFKADPWCDVFLYVFGFEPNDELSKAALNFIYSIPNTDLCITNQANVIEWLSKKRHIISSVVKDKYQFFEFMIVFRNIVHHFNGQPQITKEDIFKMYDITL